jgi:hypothetical protein
VGGVPGTRRRRRRRRAAADSTVCPQSCRLAHRELGIIACRQQEQKEEHEPADPAEPHGREGLRRAGGGLSNPPGILACWATQTDHDTTAGSQREATGAAGDHPPSYRPPSVQMGWAQQPPPLSASRHHIARSSPVSVVRSRSRQPHPASRARVTVLMAFVWCNSGGWSARHSVVAAFSGFLAL